MIKPRISVSPLLGAAVGLWIYLDRSALVLPFLLSALLHELAHLLCMAVLRVPVHAITLRLHGAVIRAEFASPRQEALCTLAGPVCNLLLLAFRRLWPQLALCSLLLFCYNCIPLYPLDGGRLLRLLCRRLFGSVRGEKLSRIVGVLFVLALCGLCLYAAVGLRLGLMPCVFAAHLLLRLYFCLAKRA